MSTTYDCLYSKSVLSSRVPLLEWFSKSVKTCPTIVGKMVRWSISCYECGVVCVPETDNWGTMTDKIYSQIICSKCFSKHTLTLIETNNKIPQWEI